jgi:murein DD-endopeptidase MepM/ murein hydrolase activator NlpD
MGKTVYTELFDQELARTVSNTGAFGIADLLVQRVMTQEKMQEDPAAEKLDAAEPSASRHLDRPEPSAARSVLRVDGKPVVPEFRMPIQAPVSSEFGIREDPFTRKPKFHRGIDISAPRGTPVQAALGGRVLFAGFSKGYGNTVVVEHGEGYRTRYAHLGSLKVTKGDVLETEQVLGTVGSTGRSTGPHLHFEVSRYGEKIDPRTALAE